MKKLLSLLLVLALACSCAAAAETPAVTLAQLIRALTPMEILENGPFSVTVTYSNTGSENTDGMSYTTVYVKNGEYYEINDFIYYPDGYESAAYYNTDPADPAAYSISSAGAYASVMANDVVQSMITNPVFLLEETMQITGIESRGDLTEVTVTDADGSSCLLTLDDLGRVTRIDMSELLEGSEEPTTVVYTLDYSEDIAIDYSPKEANADYVPPRVNAEGIVDIETTDINGDPVTADLIADARLVMVNLWEPWCGPCVGEMPDLQRLYETYKDQGLIILGVYSFFDMDETAQEIIREKGITYPILRCNASLAALQQNYVPATFFLNAQGEILTPEPFSGAADYEIWEARILEYLER